MVRQNEAKLTVEVEGAGLRGIAIAPHIVPIVIVDRYEGGELVQYNNYHTYGQGRENANGRGYFLTLSFSCF